jgi:ADP-heptose:LPS heptosyltransferase
MKPELAHVLICRTDNIGDVVLTLPLAGYLKQRFPGIRIGFLCRSYAAPLVRCCGAVDYVVESDKLDDAAAWLAASGIDTIIHAKPDRRIAWAAKRAGIARRVGTSHRWFHWLTCNRLAHFSRVRSHLHEAQLNFALLRPLGMDVTPALADIPPLYQLTAPPYQAEPSLDEHRFNLVLHPKSNGNGREWPIGHYTALARLLQAHGDIGVFITGSAKEGEWIAAHAPDLLAQPNVRSVCGAWDLGVLTAFIGAADGLVASGTGPLHMSAALGRPTLGLFPPIKPIDPERWGALGTRAEVLCQPQGCGACADAAACDCMRRITAGQVANVVLRWRERKAASTA